MPTAFAPAPHAANEPTCAAEAFPQANDIGPDADNDNSASNSGPRLTHRDRVNEGSGAIRYATVCSGIEAVSLAWKPLHDFKPVFFSEIERFPSAVLKHHWPDVPNLGDMEAIDGPKWHGKLDVLWASTPCQSHSRNGHRAGLDDDRGRLTLTAVKLANEINPSVFVLENVVGLLNVEGNAFGQLLASLAGEDQPLNASGAQWPNAGAVRGPSRCIAWRVLDAQYSGLAQRRERVFVVACPLDGPDPIEILFERGGSQHSEKRLREIQAEETRSFSAGRSLMWFNGDPTPKINYNIAQTLKANGGQNNLSGVMIDGQWRRLMPEEREALMAIPRNHTLVEGASDAKRNKAIGNALAVPDVRWLGERIKSAVHQRRARTVTLSAECRIKRPKPVAKISAVYDYLAA